MNGFNGWKAFEISMAILITVSLAISSWALTMILDINQRVITIEGSRFTTQDGLDFYKELNNKADMSQVPPAWLLDRINRIEQKLDALTDKLK